MGPKGERRLGSTLSFSLSVRWLYSNPVNRCCQRDGPVMESSALATRLFWRARSLLSGGSEGTPSNCHSPCTPVRVVEWRGRMRSGARSLGRAPRLAPPGGVGEASLMPAPLGLEIG